VWNEKANLLKRGMELNPFSSEHFYWIDIGSLRYTGTFTIDVNSQLFKYYF
jgi:hypothetical protein